MKKSTATFFLLLLVFSVSSSSFRSSDDPSTADNIVPNLLQLIIAWFHYYRELLLLHFFPPKPTVPPSVVSLEPSVSDVSSDLSDQVQGNPKEVLRDSEADVEMLDPIVNIEETPAPEHVPDEAERGAQLLRDLDQFFAMF